MKILLAVDDSKFSEAATKAVVAQASRQDTEVRVLHVVDTSPHFISGELGVELADTESVRQAQTLRGEELVARTAEALRAAGLKVHTEVEDGEPKTRILDCAAAWPADLIVVGSHGRKGLERFFLGSVSEAVARHAHCSVEIVRVEPGRN